jgi:lipopolysaccharide heptosyltransferase II
MKILIIRFSSFGDVLQCLSVAGALKNRYPEAEIHWVTRVEFAPLIETHPAVKKVWTIRRGLGWRDLWRLGRQLRLQKFTHVYDAHNNLRSHVIGWAVKGFLDWRRFTGQVRFLRRSIYRFRRFLLFRFHINLFPQPFSGQRALLEPLHKWNVKVEAPETPQLFFHEHEIEDVARKVSFVKQNQFVALAPSAAFELKRWPVEYWKALVREMPKTHFALLGGPEDRFLREIEEAAPDRVVNLAGKLSLNESAAVIASSRALVSNDTGLMHVAEQIGKPCIALMGPAPFGFPSRPLTKILQVPLDCRPCSKHGQGPCVNAEFHRCMRDIRPEQVARELSEMIS